MLLKNHSSTIIYLKEKLMERASRIKQLGGRNKRALQTPLHPSCLLSKTILLETDVSISTILKFIFLLHQQLQPEETQALIYHLNHKATGIHLVRTQNSKLMGFIGQTGSVDPSCLRGLKSNH